MSRKSTTAVAIASSLALTGLETQADIVTTPEDSNFIVVAETLEADVLILGDEEGDLALPPLLDVEDNIGFDERYAQTWFGGTGNDGLLTAPVGPDRKITPKPGVADGVSKPARATTPKLRTPKNKTKTLRKSRTKKKR